MLKLLAAVLPLVGFSLQVAWAQSDPVQPAPVAQAPRPPAACPGNPEALGTARVLAIDPATLPPVGLKTYPRTLDLADHEVVLTFDDGPSARTTPRVLAALEHDCTRATFFLIGRNAETARALVRREIADGDLVGHHSWSHPAVTERGLREGKARADIDRGFAADDKSGYGVAAAEPRIPVFRFPGFGDSPALLAWLAHRHIAVFSADLWASDWIEQTPQAELALLMGRLDRVGRGIILLHDIKTQTADMMPDFLAALKAGHYRVVALTLGSDPTPVRPAPAGWTSETEHALEALWPRLVRQGAMPFPTESAARPVEKASSGAAARPSPSVQDLPLRSGEDPYSEIGPDCAAPTSSGCPDRP